MVAVIAPVVTVIVPPVAVPMGSPPRRCSVRSGGWVPGRGELLTTGGGDHASPWVARSAWRSARSSDLLLLGCIRSRLEVLLRADAARTKRSVDRRCRPGPGRRWSASGRRWRSAPAACEPPAASLDLRRDRPLLALDMRPPIVRRVLRACCLSSARLRPLFARRLAFLLRCDSIVVGTPRARALRGAGQQQRDAELTHDSDLSKSDMLLRSST